HSGARFNLAASGVESYPLTELPVSMGDLAINGPTIYGYAPLQERLAQKSGVSPDCVVAAAGTSLANHLAIAGSVEPGDEVLIEERTYELLLSTARYLGAEVRRFARNWEDDFRVSPEIVAKHITPRTRLIVLTNLHNPSGALIDDATLTAVGQLARDVGARVLVDEVYLETLFHQPWRSAYHLGDNFVITSSLTKAYGLSGLRCGWILAQPDLARRIWRINDLYAATPVHPAELMSVIALDNLQKVADRADSIIECNREAWDALLHAHPGLWCFRPQFGTVVFPRLSRGTADEFFDFLTRQYETSVVPGRFFEMPQHFRVGLGGNSIMTLEGMRRLGTALDQWDSR